MHFKHNGHTQKHWKTRLDEFRSKSPPTAFYPPFPDWEELMSEGDHELEQNHQADAIRAYHSSCEAMGVGDSESLKRLADERALHPWMLKPLIKLTATYGNFLDGEAFRAHGLLAELVTGLLAMWEGLAPSNTRTKVDSFHQRLQQHGPEVKLGHLRSFEPMRLLAREMDADFTSAMNLGRLLPKRS